MTTAPLVVVIEAASPSTRCPSLLRQRASPCSRTIAGGARSPLIHRGVLPVGVLSFLPVLTWLAEKDLALSGQTTSITNYYYFICHPTIPDESTHIYSTLQHTSMLHFGRHAMRTFFSRHRAPRSGHPPVLPAHATRLPDQPRRRDRRDYPGE